MELHITGQNVELSESVRRHIERKLGKLNRYLPNIMESKVEITEEKTKSRQQRYLVRVTVNSSTSVLHGEERGPDLLTAIDKVSEIMNRQIEHHKGKLYKKGRGNSLARGVSSEETEPASPPGELVKVKRFALKPMSTAEAMDQMKLLGHDFFLFFNADTEEINLLYRRRDGNYGLIEPELG
ncbi:ribosome hibernation-promoting factor, HPF/YfiA family [Chloroflexota bacterium]